MSRRFAVLAIALAGCSVARAEQDGLVTPYSCEGIEVGPQLAAEGGEIVAPWRELAGSAVEDRASRSTGSRARCGRA